jgi:hypothetical protein
LSTKEVRQVLDALAAVGEALKRMEAHDETE